MKRILAIVATLLAVLAVSVPSLAAGARGMAEHPAPILVLQASGNYVKAPCPLGGTSRVMVCQTDIGVLPNAVRPHRVTAETRHALVQESMVGGIASRPHLPPPKTA